MKNKIKYFRKQQKMSLTTLSNITDLSVSYLCHLEKGIRQNPSFNAMSKISTALNKNITDVFLN